MQRDPHDVRSFAWRSRAWIGALLLHGSALLPMACSSNAPPAASPDAAEEPGPIPESSSDATPRSWPWVERTFSPRPGSPFDPNLEALMNVCGQGDQALQEVAQVVAELQAEQGQPPGLDEVRFHLRRRGSPYVMPRLWSAVMAGVSQEQLVDYVQQWADSYPAAVGELRCGAGSADVGDGTRVVAVLQMEVLAHLEPLPTQTDTGTWLDLEAQFLEPPTSASVILLPPEGEPRTIETKVQGERARARFAVQTPGTWLVQVMSTQTGGPRPVATALVTAGEPPPSYHAAKPVPGEDAFDAKLAPDDALFELMNAARAEMGLPLLERNRKLDRVANAHSKAMLEAGRISHDTGLGDPAFRVAQAGIKLRATGENVALAQSVPRLHRVLWASPSHRQNLLLRRWDSAGVAIAEREDGSLFATQLFADR